MDGEALLLTIAKILASLGPSSEQASSVDLCASITLLSCDSPAGSLLKLELQKLALRVGQLTKASTTASVGLPETPDEIYDNIFGCDGGPDTSFVDRSKLPLEHAKCTNTADSWGRSASQPDEATLVASRPNIEVQPNLLGHRHREYDVNAPPLNQKRSQQTSNEVLEQHHVVTLQRELWRHRKANEAFQKALREIGEIVTAVARGDLTMKVRMDTVELDPEITTFKRTINAMMDRLQTFASEVSRVAREVGTEGLLGGQARISGVHGTWKELTDNGRLL